MSAIRRLLVAAAAAGLVAGVAGARSATAGDAGAAACKPGEVRAVVGGRRVCLREGARCTPRFDSGYHRYGFHCHDGELVRDDVLLLRKRPLVTPRVAAGDECPLSPSTGSISRFDPTLSGTTFGNGPAYPRFYPPAGNVAEQRPRLGVGRGDFSRPGWLFGKVLWVVDHRDRAHRGNALLIRGRRVDASGELRFSGGLAPRLVLRTVRTRGSEIGVREPGCYALQIDGRGFGSRVIVFEAVLNQASASGSPGLVR